MVFCANPTCRHLLQLLQKKRRFIKRKHPKVIGSIQATMSECFTKSTYIDLSESSPQYIKDRKKRKLLKKIKLKEEIFQKTYD